jgi:hypothetical protein
LPCLPGCHDLRASAAIVGRRPIGPTLHRGARLAFTGPYPTTFSGNTDAMVVSRTTFSGGVTNAGTIGGGGISVSSSTFLSGGIVDTGVISGGIRIDSHSRIVASGITAVAIEDTTTFRGGISNAGTIAGGLHALVVSSVSAFTGDISNTGAISASTFVAIYVDGASTFAGAIVNSGRIQGGSGTALNISDVSTFAGGISNSGIISVLNRGIRLKSVGSFGAHRVGGGITNSGTISAQGSGILIQQVGRFAGGITNSGTLSATEWGIEVFQLYSSFSGGINNSGKITTKLQDGIILSGVAVFGDPTAGSGITNSGVISGGGSGVFIDQAYSRFLDGISNSGKIAVARHAIAITSVNVFDPPNGGAIVNSGTVSAGQTGIVVGFVYGSLAGGISNSGKITAGGKGIVLGLAFSGTSVSVANFFGGIVNSSTISAHGTGVEVRNVQSTFSGGISNSGRIASKSGNGILVGNVAVFSDVSAGGGIVNTGMIAAGSAGIGLFAISIFTGGISNSGSISATNRGVQLGVSTSTTWAVSSFTGDIANAGTIVAATGIALFDSTVAGAIVDSGSINAVSRGILIDSAQRNPRDQDRGRHRRQDFHRRYHQFRGDLGFGRHRHQKRAPGQHLRRRHHRRHGRHRDPVRRQRQHADARRRLRHQRRGRSCRRQRVPAWRHGIRHVQSQLDRPAIQGLHHFQCHRRQLDGERRGQRHQRLAH